MKSIEINMSALSQAQKQLCVELIAHSNIRFQQKDNQYVAHLQLHPPPTPPLPSRSRELQGKKPLGRAVRVGELRRLEELHRCVEIYVYPKRMPLGALCELVENAYERFWGEHKRKSGQVRSISFAEWFYRSTVAPLRDRLRAEQLLVNLIDSLNHYLPKEPGLRLFHRFLAERWPADALFYFLVLRGILEQVTDSRILDRSLPGPWGHRLRTNPYEKAVSDEEVKAFLGTLASGGISCSRSRPKPLEGVYQALTEKMFWEEGKRRNFIFFFDLLEHLVLEFAEGEDSSSCRSLPLPHPDPEPTLPDLTLPLPEQPPQAYILEVDPAQEERINERVRQEKLAKSALELQSLVRGRLQEMYVGLGREVSEGTWEVLLRLLETVVGLDKSVWVRFRGGVGEGELLGVERLQGLWAGGGASAQLVKAMLLLPAVRQAVLDDLAL